MENEGEITVNDRKIPTKGGEERIPDLNLVKSKGIPLDLSKQGCCDLANASVWGDTTTKRKK